MWIQNCDGLLFSLELYPEFPSRLLCQTQYPVQGMFLCTLLLCMMSLALAWDLDLVT